MPMHQLRPDPEREVEAAPGRRLERGACFAAWLSPCSRFPCSEVFRRRRSPRLPIPPRRSGSGRDRPPPIRQCACSTVVPRSMSTVACQAGIGVTFRSNSRAVGSPPAIWMLHTKVSGDQSLGSARRSACPSSAFRSKSTGDAIIMIDPGIVIGRTGCTVRHHLSPRPVPFRTTTGTAPR